MPCGVVSIESSGLELLERIFSSTGNIPAEMLATGFWGVKQMADIQDLAGNIKGKPLYIYDKPNLQIGQLKSVARVMVKLFGIKILFVDYLQLIRNTNTKLDKTGVVMESSQQLKELARELNIPVVCLAQLGRDADERRPTLGSFQWASQIEQDADGAFLIWHEQKDEGVETKLLVEKMRDGKKGAIDMVFNGDYVRFEERSEK